MINALWLLLIVPASACIGFCVAALCVNASILDASSEIAQKEGKYNEA